VQERPEGLADLHERITGMLLIHMLALLAYSLLERQVRRNGLQMTTRRIIETLESLEVIGSVCWDGSRLYRTAPVNEGQVHLLGVLAQVLANLRCPRWPLLQLPAGEHVPLPLSPPGGHEGTVQVRPGQREGEVRQKDGNGELALLQNRCKGDWRTYAPGRDECHGPTCFRLSMRAAAEISRLMRHVSRPPIANNRNWDILIVAG